MRPKFCRSFGPQEKRGRREDRVRAAPAVSCANCAFKKRTRAYRFSGDTPAFPAQWLYGLCRALPGDEFLLVTVISELTVLPSPVGPSKPPPTWHQQRMPGPHGFAVRFNVGRLHAANRSRAFRQPAPPSRVTPNAVASTASRPNVRDDGQRPSERDGMANHIR
jgi:hypothetical protein